jgi:basic membrane protein A
MRYRALFALLAVAVVLSPMTAQCGQPATVVVTEEVEKAVTKEVPVGAESPLTGTKLKVAAVLPGPVNDAGWTTSAYLGLVDLRDKYNYEIAYTEHVGVAGAGQIMREYAEAGFDVIIAHGFEYADQIHAVAEEYPDTNFIHNNGSADDLANLYTITFSAGEGGYFMGRLACQITRSGKVAYVAGTEFPILSHHMKMSRQACEDIGKGDVEVIESYVGSWNDPAQAKELAAAAIERGVDVLILEADAGDPGTVEAAVEAAEGGKYIRVISWVKDKSYLAPELVIGGWEERVSRNFEYCVEKIVKGEPGGHFAIGLKEGAVGLNPFYGLVPLEVENDIVSTLQKYLEDPASLPNLEVRTDL